MNIKKWLEDHNISTHTIAAVWGVATILWASDPAFKNYIFLLYKDTPKSMHQFIAGVLIPLAVYFNAQRKSTHVTAEISPGETGAVGAVATSNSASESSNEVK